MSIYSSTNEGHLFLPDAPQLLVPNIGDEAGIEGLKGIESYYQRVMSILRQKDYLVMNDATKKSNIELIKLYKDLCLEIIDKNNIIYVEDEGNISDNVLNHFSKNDSEYNFVASEVIPFISSPQIDQMCELLNLETSRHTQASEKINNKGYAQSQLRNLGVDTPEGKTVYTLDEATEFYEHLKSKGYEYITLKNLRAASGLGVHKIETNKSTEFFDKLNDMQEELDGGILIDAWIEGEFISSPNIQFYVGKTSAQDKFISCSDQILMNGGTVHAGNISDNSILEIPKIKKNLKIIIDWIRQQKAFGVVGIDFAIYKHANGDIVPYFMEINGRINGSTHGAVLNNKISHSTQDSNWGVANTLPVPNEITSDDFVSKLISEGLMFNPDSKTGVLPTNLYSIDQINKAMVAVFNKNPEENRDLIYHLHNLYNQ